TPCSASAREKCNPLTLKHGNAGNYGNLLCSAECFKYLWLEFRMHPLDNPAWSALTTHQSQIALVEGMARRYPPEMAVHGALALQMPQAWEALARLARVPVGVFSIAPLRLLPGWTVTRHVELFQMVHEGDGEAKRDLAIPITELSEADLPGMSALYEATRPTRKLCQRIQKLGPFLGIRVE